MVKLVTERRGNGFWHKICQDYGIQIIAEGESISANDNPDSITVGKYILFNEKMLNENNGIKLVEIFLTKK